MIWYIVLIVALGLSVFLNIHLITLAKDLKYEVEHYGEYVSVYRTNTDTDGTN